MAVAEMVPEGIGPEVWQAGWVAWQVGERASLRELRQVVELRHRGERVSQARGAGRAWCRWGVRGRHEGGRQVTWVGWDAGKKGGSAVVGDVGQVGRRGRHAKLTR